MFSTRSLAIALSTAIASTALAITLTSGESPGRERRAVFPALVRDRGDIAGRAVEGDRRCTPPDEVSRSEPSDVTGTAERARDLRPQETVDAPTARVARLVSDLDLMERPRDSESAIRDALVELGLGDQDLLTILGDCCGIRASDVPRGVAILDHAARVARVGARGIATERDFYGEDFESHFPAAIEFGVATDETNAVIAPKHEFAATTGKIYASFAQEMRVGANVLVKWTHLDRSTVHVFGKYPVDVRATHNFVWLELPDDWPSGMYAVEIYSLRRGLTPVAGGRYVVP